MKVDELAKQFEKNAASDEQAMIEAQIKTIISLNKKLKALEEKNTHLEGLLKQTNPIIVSLDEQGIDEELIARSELRKLRQYSQDRELSMEETKKVEIYSKIMQSLANKPKKLTIDTKNLKTEELLSSLDLMTDEE